MIRAFKDSRRFTYSSHSWGNRKKCKTIVTLLVCFPSENKPLTDVKNAPNGLFSYSNASVWRTCKCATLVPDAACTPRASLSHGGIVVYENIRFPNGKNRARITRVRQKIYSRETVASIMNNFKSLNQRSIFIGPVLHVSRDFHVQ